MGIIDHGEEFGVYFEQGQKPVKAFDREVMRLPSFLKEHSGCHIRNILEGARVQTEKINCSSPSER